MIFTKKPKPKPPEQPPIKRSGSASWTDRLQESIDKPGNESAFARDIKPTELKIDKITWY